MISDDDIDDVCSKSIPSPVSPLTVSHPSGHGTKSTHSGLHGCSKLNPSHAIPAPTKPPSGSRASTSLPSDTHSSHPGSSDTNPSIRKRRRHKSARNATSIEKSRPASACTVLVKWLPKKRFDGKLRNISPSLVRLSGSAGIITLRLLYTNPP